MCLHPGLLRGIPLLFSGVTAIKIDRMPYFDIHFPDKSGLGFSIVNHFNLDNNIGFEYFGYVLIGTGGCHCYFLSVNVLGRGCPGGKK